jgi:hypothetical protein
LNSAREAEKRWRYNEVDSSAMESEPAGNGVITEAEESLLLSAITKQRLVKTLKAGEDLACSNL